MLQTVDRALLVLLGFDRSRREWGVTQVAAEFGWDKSVTHRLLATLAHRGFLASDPVSRRYRIGPAVLHLHQAWNRSGSLAMLAEPVLEELTEGSGHTSVLAVPDSFHMRCVAAVDGNTGPLRFYPLAGELYPAHAGATSKAYFAYLPDEERRRLFQDRPMARFTERTVTDIGVLEEQFRQVREQGYAVSEGEYDPGVATLALPVFLHEAPVATISIGSSRCGPGELLDDLATLREAASQLERRLSTPPPRRPAPQTSPTH
jgi:DNA-binding IclR family transcriptional regulator